MIPQRDIRFVQQQAIQLLYEGKTIEDIKQLIADQGGNEDQIQTLSLKFLTDFDFIQQANKKENRKIGSTYQIAGGVLLLCGLVLTAISYLSLDGQGAVIFWGVLLVGGILLVRGLLMK